MKLCRLAALIPFLSLIPACASQAAGKDAVSFKGRARLHTLATKTKALTAKVTYPTFTSKSPLAEYASRVVGTNVRTGYRNWLKSAKKDMKENPGGMLPYEYTGSVALQNYDPARLISFQTMTYQYLGGAHGVDTLVNHNFAVVDGKPKDLKLADLFLPGTDYRKLVQNKVFDVLKKNTNAAWVADKSVTFLTPSQFNNFQLGKNSVTWLFQEYEMGPFAAGPIEATVPVSELGPSFRKSLLPR